jgi:tRNA isopentenyl-2-thiomethyl-A-37 hydroxylase MiaE
MLENIKNFVKSVSSTTWIVLAVGVLAVIVLSWVSSHAKAPAAAPAAETAPATK